MDRRVSRRSERVGCCYGRRIYNTSIGAFLEAVDFAKKAGVGIEQLEGCLDYFLDLLKTELTAVHQAPQV